MESTRLVTLRHCTGIENPQQCLGCPEDISRTLPVCDCLVNRHESAQQLLNSIQHRAYARSGVGPPQVFSSSSRPRLARRANEPARDRRMCHTESQVCPWLH